MPTDSLWYDETVNAYLATSSWSRIWEWTTAVDNQLPLHFAVLKLWTVGLGDAAFALRLFSMFCGWLAVAGLFAAARQLFVADRYAALAVVFFILSGGFLYAATEVRTYGLALALFLWALALLMPLWRQNDAPSHYNIAILSTLLALLALTHYTAWLVIGVMGAAVTLKLMARRGEGWMAATVIFAPAVVLMLLWLVALGGRDFNAGTAFAGDVSIQQSIETYLSFSLFGQVVVTHETATMASVYAAIALSALVIWSMNSSKRSSVVLITATGMLPFVAMVAAVQLIEGKLSGRHTWMLWAVLPLILTGGVYSLRHSRWLQLGVGVLVLLFATPYTVSGTQPEYTGDFRGAFAIIDANAHPDDLLILRDGTLFTAAEYYTVSIDYIGMPQDELTNVEHQVQFFEALDILNTAELTSRRRVWVLSWQANTMDPTALGLAIPEYYSHGNLHLWVDGGARGVSLVSYDMTTVPASDLHRHVVTLPGVVQVRLDGPSLLGIDTYHARSGNQCHAIVHGWWWRGESDYPTTLVSVRLVPEREIDRFGLPQIDQPPAGFVFPQSRWEPFVPILDRSELRYSCSLLNTQGFGPLRLQMVVYDSAGNAPSQPIDLGAIPPLAP